MSNYDLKKPCKHCPFRTDIPPFLRRGAAEAIVDSLVQAEFPCHKTIEHDDDGNGIVTRESQHCAGALIMLEHMEQPSQMMRIAERINLYNRFELDMDAPVFHDAQDFIDAQDR